MNIKVWDCKIGGRLDQLEQGADWPMRQAIKEAYRKLTGREPEFCFSGWNGELDDTEKEIAYPSDVSGG